MAYAIRIDDVQRDAETDRVEFRITTGRTPLPGAWNGMGVSFGTVAQTLEAIADVGDDDQRQLAELLMLFLLRTIRRRFPNLSGAQFRNAVQGATITVNLDAATRADAITIS